MPLYLINLLIAACVIGISVIYFLAERKVYKLSKYIIDLVDTDEIDLREHPELTEAKEMLVAIEDIVVLGSGAKGQSILESCLNALNRDARTAVNTITHHEEYAVYTTRAGVRLYYVDSGYAPLECAPKGLYRAYIQGDLTIDEFDRFNAVWQPKKVSVISALRDAQGRYEAPIHD